MASAVSGRYIPKPNEVTPRNKTCQEAAVLVGVAGIALVGIAFISFSRSLNSRIVMMFLGGFVAGVALRSYQAIRHVSTSESGLKDPLYKQFDYDNKTGVRLLLFFGANPNYPRRCFGMTLLHNATDPYMVEQLISYGADVNARSVSQDTPLHKAMEGSLDLDKKKVIELLFRNGADPNAVNSRGSTPLKDATLYRDSAVGSPGHSHWEEIVQLLSSKKG